MRVRLLVPGEERQLAALETAAWPGPLQASQDRIMRRMELGHRVMVAENDGKFIAATCYIPTANNPFDRCSFPKTFGLFSSLPRSEPVRSVYVYNLCVHPDQRGGSVVRQVIETGIHDAATIGARFVVADGRCPSYAGSTEWPDTVGADSQFREAIDKWHSTGVRPSDAELIRDPVLRFYKRILSCDFLYLMPNFLPEDAAAGGFRVIFVKDLMKAGEAQWC